MRYVALLRGINVGGNNVIAMAALRERFEALGFADVVTYIQSGNVVFSTKARRASLPATIERDLGKAFGYVSKVVVVSVKDLERVVAEAPEGFGAQPARYRYDVLFVRPPLTPRRALAEVTTKPGVDAVSAGKHGLYFRRLIAKATQSHLPKLVMKPAYQNLTVRNWNTTTKLLALACRA